MKTITLITGGVRSGKSRHALELAEARLPEGLSGSKPGQRNRELAEARSVRRSFLATAQAFDEEMKVRIARHQAERGNSFLTREEPLYLSQAVAAASAETDLILIDCLTLWLNNLLYHFAGQPEQVKREIQSLIGMVGEKRTDMILVTNEIGMGVVPDNPLSRRFLEEQGRLNQELARLSDEVILMISGIPQVIKGARVDSKLDSAF